MKVLNLLWKFSTGGIGKCFITYSQCGLDDDIEMTSVCIVPNNSLCDRSFLIENNILQIYIKNRRDLSWIRQLYKLMIKLNPDVIFTHGLYGPIIVEVTKFFHPSIRKIPMIVSFHGLYNPPTKTMFVFAPLFNKIMAWICKYRASKIIIVSKYAGEYLLQQGVPPEKLKLVYNGISEEMPYYIPIQLPLFGSVKGIQNSAIYNTFIETCKQAGVSFRDYFCRLLREFKKGRTDYENLLPMTICK